MTAARIEIADQAKTRFEAWIPVATGEMADCTRIAAALRARGIPARAVAVATMAEEPR